MAAAVNADYLASRPGNKRWQRARALGESLAGRRITRMAWTLAPGSAENVVDVWVGDRLGQMQVEAGFLRQTSVGYLLCLIAYIE